jgi:hypothetical protein
MRDSAVQSLWIGGRLGTMGRLAVRSFLAAGHEFHLYCYDAPDDLPAGAAVRDAGEILSRDQVFTYRTGFGSGSYSAFSNLFRYKLLLDRGGWWVDTDVVCLQPFHFAADHVLASEYRDPIEDDRIGIASSVLKQPAGSPLMRWAWRNSRYRDAAAIQWGEIGPRLLQAGVNAFGWQDLLSPPRAFSPVSFYDWRTLIDPSSRPVFDTGVFAVHLWHQMWREAGVDPNADQPAGCLFEELKQRFL